MKRLAILISAPSARDAQEALDDAVASIAAGQVEGRHEANGTRVQFAWHGREDAQAKVVEEVAELPHQAWEAGLSADQVQEESWRLALRKIRGQAA